MIIDPANLELVFKGCKTVYSDAFEAAEARYDKIAMTVPSSSDSKTYGWIGQFPQLREWVGPRHLNNLSAYGFTIKNRAFESTVAVTGNNIEDDKRGIFKPMFAEMGNFARRHPEELVFDLLRRGFDTSGFDGSNVFSGSHRLKDQDGEEVAVSNTQTGSGQPWFLLDTSRAIRPIIWQERSP